MLKKVDHVTIIVKNLDKAIKDYENILHLTPEDGRIRDLPAYRLVMLPVPSGARIEVVEPKKVKSMGSDFLKERGEGVCSLSIFMDDFDNEVKKLREKGITVTDEIVATVHEGYPLRLGWVSPEQAHGVWLELVDAKSLPPHLR
jgi:methylmalonyl-CoA/ethylmalonyl-CoA epimerase